MKLRELCEEIHKHYSIKTEGKSKIIINGQIIPKNNLKSHLSTLENPVEIVHTLVGPQAESLYLSVFDELKRMEKEKFLEGINQDSGILKGFKSDPSTFLKYVPVKNLMTSEVAMLCSKTGTVSNITYDS